MPKVAAAARAELLEQQREPAVGIFKISSLSIPDGLKQNPVMENESDKAVGFRGLVEWATTRPQAYATYFVALILIGGLSFYAGTLKPKKVPSAAPPAAVSVPHD
jgi:hypothetical protein